MRRWKLNLGKFALNTSLSFIGHQHWAAEISNFEFAWIVCLKRDPELVFSWVSVKDILEEVSIEVRYKRLAVILNS